MPKQKTLKSAKKRFKVSSNGKVQFRPGGKSHLLSGKSSKRRRQMRRWRSFEGKHDERDIQQMIHG